MSATRWWLISLVMGMLSGLNACQSNQNSSEETALPYYNTPDFTPIWLEDTTQAAQKITHRIADFSFQDQNNQAITQATVMNKIHVANFFFSICPSVCPKMTNLLKAVQDTFRTNPDVLLLSYSVMPWVDSTARLRLFAHRKNIDSDKWHLLTGDKGQIYNLARLSYFAEEAIGFTKDSTQFLHTEHVLLVDRNRRIRGVYNGTVPLDIDKLIVDIKVLLRENGG